MATSPLYSSGPPRVLAEKVIAVRGKQVIKGRIVLYHNGQLRRCELMIENDPLGNHMIDVGLTLDEIAELHKLLYKFGVENGELA